MSDHDIPLVAAMNRRLQQDECADVLPTEQIEARLRGWIGSGQYSVLLIKHSDQVVGYLLYTTEPLESSAIYIRQLYIERNYRRQGYGAATIQAFAENHTERGRPIEIDVFTWNNAGHAFWEAIGFHPCHTRMRLDRVNSRDG